MANRRCIHAVNAIEFMRENIQGQGMSVLNVASKPNSSVLIVIFEPNINTIWKHISPKRTDNIRTIGKWNWIASKINIKNKFDFLSADSLKSCSKDVSYIVESWNVLCGKKRFATKRTHYSFHFFNSMNKDSMFVHHKTKQKCSAIVSKHLL